MGDGKSSFDVHFLVMTKKNARNAWSFDYFA